MSFKTTLTKATLLIGKHSPAILTSIGVVGVGATAYFTYKAAPKVEAIIFEAREAEEMSEEPGCIPVDRKQVVKDIAKEMALPVGTGLLSIGCFVWSYNIQAGRLTALSGAFSALSGSMEDFKSRYLEKYGEEALQEFLSPTRKESRTEVDAKGKEKEVLEDVKADDNINYMAGFWFSNSEEYYSDAHDYNLQWVNSRISQLEMKIFQEGVLLMNDVLENLGLERTRLGALLGWTTNAGFDVRTYYLWNEVTQMREPQIYIHWSTPKYVYDNIPLGDIRSYDTL